MTFVLFLAEQSDCRFTFTRCLGSGNYASQDWASKMLVNTVVRCVRRSFQKLHQGSLCEYGKNCSRSVAKVAQANTTPRREARILLEVEETQAEIVGPAELFLR